MINCFFSKNIWLMGLLLFLGVAYAQTSLQIDIVNSDQDRIPFQVEVVDTPQKRAQGLMFRQSLPKQHGMLFIFAEPTYVGFWMRNTYIPLDLIFVDENKTITSIHTRLDTLSDDKSVSRKKIKYVIEINAGEAAAYKIKPGDTVSF